MVVLVIALSELGAVGIIKLGNSLVILKLDLDRKVEVVVYDARDAFVEVLGQVAVVQPPPGLPNSGEGCVYRS
jgi:hypothetical protein